MANRLVKAGATILAASNTGEQPPPQPGPPGAAAACPTTVESLATYHKKYHDDSVCDRQKYDAFKRNLGKHLTHKVFIETKEHNLVPNQKTLVCPAVVNDLSNPHAPVGYDTNWFVENTASKPVLLAWVKEGIEYSAVDTSISPPEADPKAVLKPGEWRHVNTFEGHVFHARELTDDGSPGKVLLQHRAGLVPIGSKARQWLTCPTDDPEPLVTDAETGMQIRDPAFARTKERPLKDCHLMDLGFRNMAGCPLNVYWQVPDTCEEVFKFHLGTNGYSNDFHWDWESPTKFESTKVGHTFVFRSPSQPDQLVDSITLLPTQIVDCPDLKQKVAMSIMHAAEIVIPVGQTLSDAANDDAHTAVQEAAAAAAAVTNSTGDAAAAATSAARRHNNNRNVPDYSSILFRGGFGSSPPI